MGDAFLLFQSVYSFVFYTFVFFKTKIKPRC